MQTFIMTFLGEWGDRSQIATIAMAAGQDYWWVTSGAVTGHGFCTAIAVIGGRAIAGRVSLRIGKSNFCCIQSEDSVLTFTRSNARWRVRFSGVWHHLSPRGDVHILKEPCSRLGCAGVLSIGKEFRAFPDTI